MQTENLYIPIQLPNPPHYCHSLETKTIQSLYFFPSIYSGEFKCPAYISQWNRMILCHYGSNKISFWNTQNLDLIDSRYTREKIHLAAAFSNKLKFLYTGGLGGQVSALKVEQNCFGSYQNDIISPKIGDEVTNIVCLDEQNLIACTSGDKNICLLDSRTLKIVDLLTLNEGRIVSEIAYIPKSGVLAVVCRGRKDEINFFCLKSRKCILKIFICKDIRTSIFKFCESKNMLITQCKMNMIKLWSLSSGALIKANKTIHLDEKPNSILILEDDDCFLVSFQSEKLQLYRLSTGILFQSFEVPFVVGGVFNLSNEKKILIVNSTLTQFAVIRFH